MFRQVFDPDNLFWRIMARGVDFVGLSIFWIALCLPVVTIGPATAALYYTFVVVLLTVQMVVFGLERWWPVAFAPTLTTLLVSLFLERIFPKYLNDEERARLEDKPPENETED